MSEHEPEPTHDVISGGGAEQWADPSPTTITPSAAPTRRFGMTATKLTAVSTALAVVVAGGVVVAAWRSASHGHAPEELIPANAFAVASMDLSLPDGQSSGLQGFANHFPNSPTQHGSGSGLDRLLRAMFRTSSDPHADYDADIKPWLGDHVAVAGWIDSSGKPQVEGVLQSTDDTKARQLLTKVTKSNGGAFRFADGYAVVASTDALVGQAIAAAHRKSLADVATYAQDVSALPGTPFVTGWVDGAGVRSAIQAALGANASRLFGRMGAFGMLGGPMGLMNGGVGSLGAGNPLAGQVAVGVRVTDSYVEVDSRASGQPAGHQAPSSTFTGLPDSTIAAVQMGDPQSLVRGAMSMVKMFTGMGAAFSSKTECAIGAVPEPAFPSSGSAPSPREIRKLKRQLDRQARTSVQHCKTLRPPPAPDPAAMIAKATGLQLPQDASTLLGDSLVVSYGGLELTGLPKIAIRTHPANVAAAAAVARRLQAHVGRGAHVPLIVHPTSSDLILATSPDYASAVEQGGSLGSQTQAKLALGDVPGEIASAGYVDLSRILPLMGAGAPPDVTHLKAIGFWSGSVGGVQLAQLRLVVG